MEVRIDFLTFNEDDADILEAWGKNSGLEDYFLKEINDGLQGTNFTVTSIEIDAFIAGGATTAGPGGGGGGDLDMGDMSGYGGLEWFIFVLILLGALIIVCVPLSCIFNSLFLSFWGGF